MKAMIFAAGLGTRLRPYTNNKPKALVEINGIPLLEYAINKVAKHGFKEIVINIHHFGDLILDFIRQRPFEGIQIHISDERALLLNTGGGLKKAAALLGSEPFLVYNTDVLTDLNLSDLYQYHLTRQSLATLAVRQRKSSRFLLFNDNQTLIGWKNNKTGEIKMSRESTAPIELAFSGIHVIDPKLFHFTPDTEVFSIIDVYLEAAKKNDILGFDHSSSKWMDVGRVKDLELAQSIIQEFG